MFGKFTNDVCKLLPEFGNSQQRERDFRFIKTRISSS
jgi:hypothetical protein